MNHPHDQPPKVLGPAINPNLPQREVVTPMGISTFQDANLEKKGYRYSFSKEANDRLVEIVYLKDDGSTGTIIADLESLFDTRIIVDDTGNPLCRVTFKLLNKVTNPIQLQCADVPVSAINSGFMGKMFKNLLDHFLGNTYGLQQTDSDTEEANSPEAVQSGVD